MTDGTILYSGIAALRVDEEVDPCELMVKDEEVFWLTEFEELDLIVV
jgi:hypothetical protein